MISSVQNYSPAIACNPNHFQKAAASCDSVAFSGVVSGVKDKILYPYRVAKVLRAYIKGMSAKNPADRVDLMKLNIENSIRLSRNIKEPVSIRAKLRRQKGEIDLNLSLKEYEGQRFYAIENKDELLAYVSFSEKGMFTRKGKAIYLTYINNETGRDRYKGLEQILLQALAEHKINQGQLPFIQGVTLNSEAKIQKALTSTAINSQLGAKKLGRYMKGIAEDQDAINILNRIKNKGSFIFPETADNIDKLLARYGQPN